MINHLTFKQIPISAKLDYQYISRKVSFVSGDRFVLLTDGLTEVSNSQHEEFGIERIQKILIDNINHSLEKLFEKVLSEIDNYGQQKDDQTMMLINCL